MCGHQKLYKRLPDILWYPKIFIFEFVGEEESLLLWTVFQMEDERSCVCVYTYVWRVYTYMDVSISTHHVCI